MSLLTLLVIVTMAVAGEPRHCASLATVIQNLADKYGEFPTYAGDADGAQFVVMVNPRTTTWTILIKPSPTIACVGATGENWQDIPQGKGT